MVSMNDQNPIGLNGIEFIEFAGPDSHFFENVFGKFGFKQMGQVHGKNIRLVRQGHINFIVNCEPHTFANDFSKIHGTSVSAVGLRVDDSQNSFEYAVARGGIPVNGNEHQKGATSFPAIYGIGDSLIYLVDDNGRKNLYENIFQISQSEQLIVGAGLISIDHFSNNVSRGEMTKWRDFYHDVFSFQEVNSSEIRGTQTGLLSKVMRSPCGKFCVSINEPTEEKSQIQEYLEEYKGSGIQDIAFLTDDIFSSLERLKEKEVQFLMPPLHHYYELLTERVPHVFEEIAQLEKHAILVDGDKQGYLLQIFTKNIFGPIFFEFIQRKKHEGFGDRNFQVLFDAIERDQKERGYLS